MSHLPSPLSIATRFKRSVDFKSATSVVLGTTVGLFLPTHIVFHLTTVAGFLTPATVSVGTNAATYDNILTATALANLDVADEILPITLTLGTVAASIPSGTGIRANVTVAATGTTVTGNVLVLGVYL